MRRLIGRTVHHSLPVQNRRISVLAPNKLSLCPTSACQKPKFGHTHLIQPLSESSDEDDFHPENGRPPRWLIKSVGVAVALAAGTTSAFENMSPDMQDSRQEEVKEEMQKKLRYTSCWKDDDQYYWSQRPFYDIEKMITRLCYLTGHDRVYDITEEPFGVHTISLTAQDIDLPAKLRTLGKDGVVIALLTPIQVVTSSAGAITKPVSLIHFYPYHVLLQFEDSSETEIDCHFDPELCCRVLKIRPAGEDCSMHFRAGYIGENGKFLSTHDHLMSKTLYYKTR